MSEENYLTQDNDGHWYVIPKDRETDWNDFLNLDPDDEESWEPPKWADQIGGSPSLVIFQSYRID